MVPPGELSVAMNMNVDALSQNYSFSITAPSYFIHIIKKGKGKGKVIPLQAVWPRGWVEV